MLSFFKLRMYLGTNLVLLYNIIGQCVFKLLVTYTVFCNIICWDTMFDLFLLELEQKL